MCGGGPGWFREGRRRGPGGWRTPLVWQVLGALFLLVMGGIHLYLVLTGVGGTLGVLFMLNTVGVLVLAIAVVGLRGGLLLVASALSLLFMAGTLLALVLALTVGLFGIHEVLSFHRRRREPDLFWALRGGAAGTGVAARAPPRRRPPAHRRRPPPFPIR